MANVSEETCNLKHKELTKHVSEIHDVVYKNGLAESLIRIDERTKSGEKVTKINTSLILILLIAVLSATAWAVKEVASLRSILIGDIPPQGKYCAD